MHYKNFWILLIMLLAGIVLGGFMGQLVITFGLTIKITMASIIGVAVALIIYRYI